MKLAFIIPTPNFLLDLVKPLEEMGHTVLINRCTDDTDFIIGWSISVNRDIEGFHRRYSHIPLITYNWDMYHWIKEHPRGYPWNDFALLMKDSLEVWVPSDEVRLRQEEYFNVKTPTRTIKSFARFFEPTTKVEDGRFLMNHMRVQPDKCVGNFESVCQELGIPYMSPDHSLSEEEFQRRVATCTALVCPFYEASTGGLTILEGHRLGKPVVLCDSQYQGGREYMGDRAIYYKWDDREEMKRVLLDVFDNPPKLDLEECKKHCANFTHTKMAEDIDTALKELYNKTKGDH